MTRSYCTLFDERFLARGLALYRSLRRHAGRFELWVLCMDAGCEARLRALDLPGLRPLPLAELERAYPALLAAKAARSRAEYCFTCAPLLPLYLLERAGGPELITYLDADLYFFGDPEPIFAALGAGSILLIRHRFPEPLRFWEPFVGVYNVGLLVFRRDERGLACLRWWAERCLEWCHGYYDAGRFADQKYLDEWPARFAGVVELAHRGANLAPWNLIGHRLRPHGGSLSVDGDPLIFYHFHHLGWLAPWLVAPHLQRYRARMGRLLRERVYAPYVRELQAAAREIGAGPPADPLALARALASQRLLLVGGPLAGEIDLALLCRPLLRARRALLARLRGAAR